MVRTAAVAHSTWARRVIENKAIRSSKSDKEHPRASIAVQPAPRVASISAFLNRYLPTRDQILRTQSVWLALIAYVAFAKILSDTVVAITFRSPSQQDLFTWSNIATLGALGLVGIWSARVTGFPAAWDKRITTTRRLVLPAAMGLGIGVVEIGIDIVTAATQAIARVTAQPSFNIDFPGSLLAFSAGAIDVETTYRLFTLPFLVWLISSVVLRGRWQVPTLVVIGALSAAFEPVTQGVFLFLSGAGIITPLMLGGYLITALPENILAVVLFRKFGLLAPISLRLGEYLVWHIIYGTFCIPRYSHPELSAQDRSTRDMNHRLRAPALGTLVAIGSTTGLDAVGQSNVNALPLFPLLVLFSYLQRLSRAELGLTLGRWRDHGLAVFYPALVLGLAGLIAWMSGALTLTATDWAKLWFSLAIATLLNFLLALVTEEGFFRGWLWASFRHAGLAERRVLLWTSVAFAAWHIPTALLPTEFNPPIAQVPVYVLNAAVIGLIWGLMRQRSGSIVVTSVSHGVWNGLTYVLFGTGNIPGFLGIQNTGAFGPEVGVVGLALNLAFAAILWLEYSRGRVNRAVELTRPCDHVAEATETKAAVTPFPQAPDRLRMR